MAIVDDQGVNGAGVADRPTLAPEFSRGLGRARPNIPDAPDRCVNEPNQPSLKAEELAERAQAGCLDSFEQLVSLHQDHIFNFLHQFTRNRQDAEDLAQDTFLKAYRSLHRYDPSLSFEPWLFTIARRTAISHFRSHVPSEELSGNEETDLEDPASSLQTKDECASLWNLARTLKRKQWEVLWCHYGEGFSVAETARIMATNQIHVKVLLHRARASLARKLELRAAARGPELRTQKDFWRARQLEE